MMSPVSQDIAKFLETSGEGTIGVDIFMFGWGEQEESQILIMETGGFDPELQESLERPSFQILVRGNKAESALTAYNKIRSVYELLLAQLNLIIDGTCYPQFNPLAPPAGIGQDDEDRYIFSINYTTYRNPA